MQNKYISLVALILLPQSLFANQDTNNSKGLFLDLGIEDQEARPEFFVPIRWSENLYSGFGFRNSSDRVETLNSPGTVSSESDFFISDDRYKLNILTYEIKKNNSTMTYGVVYESINILEEEYGYLEIPANTYISFENVQEFGITKLSFDFGYETQVSNQIQYKLGLSYTPSPEMDFIHDIYFISGGFEAAEHNKSYSQDASYQLTMDFEFKVSELFNISLSIDYEMLPISFEYQGYTGSGYSLTSLEYEKETERMAIKFIFKKPLFADVKPVIGIKNEKIYKNNEELSDDSLIVIGIENRF